MTDGNPKAVYEVRHPSLSQPLVTRQREIVRVELRPLLSSEIMPTVLIDGAPIEESLIIALVKRG